MLCKIVDANAVTEELDWQSIGPINPARSAAERFASEEAERPSPLSTRNPGAGPSTSADQENASLKRRLAEMESQRALELEQARQNGFDHGLRQARQEAATEMEGALDRLARAIHDVAQVKRKVRSEAEAELVKLSLAVARRILHRELTADPQSLRGVVYAALQRLQNREISKIRVFPAAVPAVRAALERNGGLTGIEIIADGFLQPGGLVFETSLGELDASVETQLQEIERGFADRLQLRG